jgi:hypothetical protein
MYYWESLKQKEDAEQVLESLPTASLRAISVLGAENKDFLGVVNEQIKELVAVVSTDYQLVQHKEAFQPILDGLNTIGAKYRMRASHTKTRATLSIITENEATDGVMIGFSVKNGFDGKTALNYGFRAFKTSHTIELVGYRQVCSNGMKIEVPLDEAEFVTLEERKRITELLNKKLRIVHFGDEVQEKVQSVQYIVEALELLKNPVSRLIEASQKKEVGTKLAEEIILKYIGKRMKQRILGQFRKEEKTLWGLYNAITFVASHDREISTSTANSLIENSADLLTVETVGGEDAILKKA